MLLKIYYVYVSMYHGITIFVIIFFITWVGGKKCHLRL